MPYYTLENANGDLIAAYSSEEELPLTTLDMAIAEAKARLEDDPELGQIEVWEYAEDPFEFHQFGLELGCVEFVPDRHWEEVATWVPKGERAKAPWRVPERRMTDDEFEGYVSDAYGDDFAKAEGMRQMRDAGYV